MKKAFKNFSMLAAASIIFFMSSCEKDRFEDSSTQSGNHRNGKVNKISVDDAPLLKSYLEKFSSDRAAYRLTVEDSLKLDLANIIEYKENGDVKSYTIPIKDDIKEDENYYFSDLHLENR